MMESPEIKEQINFTDKNKKSLVTRDTLLDANIEPEKSNDKILATTGDEGGDNGDIEGLSRETSGRPLYSVFTKQQKRLIVFIASLGGFFSPLSASIYFPALNSLATDLNVSVELISLTLTSYMIFQVSSRLL